MSKRLLFGESIRQATTALQYPDALSLKEFCDNIRESVDHFEKNMCHLGGLSQEDKYVEEWAEQFLAYCEIEHE